MDVELVGVDPEIYPDLAAWEWPIAAYLFVGGLVAGLMMLSGWFRMRGAHRYDRGLHVADLMALPLLAAGLGLLWIDLANRWNAWRFFTTFRPSSAMSWGSWILVAASALLLVRAAARIPARSWWERPVTILRDAGERAGGALHAATIVGGAGLGIYTGVLLSSISARPFWDTAFLAPLFLASGLAAGGSFLCLFLDHDAHLRLAPLSMALCGIEAALVAGHLLVLSGGPEPARNAAGLVLGGPYTGWFWIAVIGIGLAIPLAIETVERIRRTIPRPIGLSAPVMKLGGSAALRFVVVFAGLQSVL